MYQPAEVFLCSAWSLQFWFHCKMSIMFNSVMFIETLTIFLLLVAKITFDTLMPFQFSLFHEFWKTFGTFESFCSHCKLGIHQFFFKHGFLLCNVLQSLFFIIWNFSFLIIHFRRKSILRCRLDCGFEAMETRLHPENIM